MKFLSIVLFGAGVLAENTVLNTATAADPAAAASTSSSSSSSGCDADYIVDRCLSTETAKIKECDALDYKCQCAAYEAVATCYNNCPNDSRAAPAQNQVKVYCQQASMQTTDKTTPTASQKTTMTTAADSTATEDDEPESSNTADFDPATPTETGAAGEVFVNAGGMLFAVAGAVAALL